MSPEKIAVGLYDKINATVYIVYRNVEVIG